MAKMVNITKAVKKYNERYYVISFTKAERKILNIDSGDLVSISKYKEDSKW